MNNEIIRGKLFDIQQRLNAPKDLFNSFGGYNYRSCESILAAVKPLLKEDGLVLTFCDTVEYIGERYYIKAVLILTDVASGEFLRTEAYAREEESKKGMDGSQVTGASSSYARKYALNALFAIDDTKDSDFTNNGTDGEKSGKIDPNDELHDSLLVCTDCGAKITEREHDYSCKNYGRPLCRSCQKKA